MHPAAHIAGSRSCAAPCPRCKLRCSLCGKSGAARENPAQRASGAAPATRANLPRGARNDGRFAPPRALAAIHVAGAALTSPWRPQRRRYRSGVQYIPLHGELTSPNICAILPPRAIFPGSTALYVPTEGIPCLSRATLSMNVFGRSVFAELLGNGVTVYSGPTFSVNAYEILNDPGPGDFDAPSFRDTDLVEDINVTGTWFCGNFGSYLFAPELSQPFA